MKEYLPDRVFDAIQRHLVAIANRAQEGWEAGRAEEDALTGHLGGQLQRRWSKSICVNGGRWRWRVSYAKFRGRGRGAFEKRYGADGIVQIEIDLMDESERIAKGVLFQAKKRNISTEKKLRRQVQQMENLAPKGSAVFIYGPESFRAIDGRIYQSELRTNVRNLRDSVSSLGTYLGEEFLPCKSGIEGMYYDAKDCESIKS